MKACPFCGSKAKKHKYTMLGEDFKVAYCPNEDCYFHHRTASIADWNTRPIEDELRKRIAELEGKIDKEKRVSNQLYLLLVDNPKDKELADSLTEAIRGTEEREDGRNEQRKSFPPVMGSGDGLGW